MRLRGAVRKVFKDFCVTVSIRHNVVSSANSDLEDVTRSHRLGLENRSATQVLSDQGT